MRRAIMQANLRQVDRAESRRSAWPFQIASRALSGAGVASAAQACSCSRIR